MDTAGGIQGSVSGLMADAVENAAIIIPFMTEQYQNSKSCNKEIEYANDLEVSIVPIRAQKKTSDGEPYSARGKLGILTAGKIYVDFTKTKYYDRKLKELITNIGSSLMDPEVVMKLINQGKNKGAKNAQDESEDLDKRIPIVVRTKDLHLACNRKGTYTETELDGPVLSISLLTKTSLQPCELGESYGFTGNRVWVSNNARGVFRVVYTTSRCLKVTTEKVPDSKILVFQSTKQKRKEKIMSTNIREVHLVKQLSRAKCTLGETFGFDGSKLWIDAGARGVFQIFFE